MSAAPHLTTRDGVRRHLEMEEESDAALLSRVSQGNLSALGVLYDRHHEGVRAFVRRATGSASDADDLTHETFLVLARAASRYDGRDSARPFIIGIASKLALGHRRMLARCGQVMRAFSGALAERSPPSPEGIASATEELRRFDRTLQRLSASKRVVVLMVDAEGLSGEEVARVLDIPIGTVWTRLHYGRAELRAALARAETRAAHASK
jgi:RNA polymerase sigma-70 factor (ECF subfamily)